MNNLADIYGRLYELKKADIPVALCVVTNTVGGVPRHAGAKMLVFADGKIEGTVGGGGVEEASKTAALEALRDGRPRTVHYSLKAESGQNLGVCGGEVDVYIEPQLPEAVLLIIGAGHVGKAVAEAASPLGMRIIVADEREELALPENFPGCQVIHAKMADLPKLVQFNSQTYVVDVSHGSNVDVEGLPGLLNEPFAYFGVIGSKKRWAATQAGLRNAGVPEERLKALKSPIGLAIEAETPAEIAISILAEVIAKKNAKSA